MRHAVSVWIVAVATVLFGCVGLASAQEAPDALLRRVGQDFLGSVEKDQVDDRAGRARTIALIETNHA